MRTSLTAVPAARRFTALALLWGALIALTPFGSSAPRPLPTTEAVAGTAVERAGHAGQNDRASRHWPGPLTWAGARSAAEATVSHPAATPPASAPSPPRLYAVGTGPRAAATAAAARFDAARGRGPPAPVRA